MSDDNELRDFQKGDWVSFMQSGSIVIGQVEYLRELFPRTDELITTAGIVTCESVLEKRSQNTDA